MYPMHTYQEAGGGLLTLDRKLGIQLYHGRAGNRLSFVSHKRCWTKNTKSKWYAYWTARQSIDSSSSSSSARSRRAGSITQCHDSKSAKKCRKANTPRTSILFAAALQFFLVLFFVRCIQCTHYKLVSC